MFNLEYGTNKIGIHDTFLRTYLRGLLEKAEEGDVKGYHSNMKSGAMLLTELLKSGITLPINVGTDLFIVSISSITPMFFVHREKDVLIYLGGKERYRVIVSPNKDKIVVKQEPMARFPNGYNKARELLVEVLTHTSDPRLRGYFLDMENYVEVLTEKDLEDVLGKGKVYKKKGSTDLITKSEFIRTLRDNNLTLRVNNRITLNELHSKKLEEYFKVYLGLDSEEYVYKYADENGGVKLIAKIQGLYLEVLW